MAAGMQYVVSGNGIAARDFILGVFQQHQWRVTLTGEWAAKAEHGSKAASFWGGAFAGKRGRYVAINISITTTPQGISVVSLIESASGLSGGAIGITQAKAVYQTMYDNIGAALSSAGIFVANIKI